MSVEDDYKKLLASAPQGQRAFECIAIKHNLIPNFYFVNDNRDLTATDEDGNQVTYLKSRVSASLSKSSDDLDQSADVTIALNTNTLVEQLKRYTAR